MFFSECRKVRRKTRRGCEMAVGRVLNPQNSVVLKSGLHQDRILSIYKYIDKYIYRVEFHFKLIEY